ncbi:MAG: hypothetical protein ACLQVN_13275 [Bryobacteraceae bacterium]
MNCEQFLKTMADPVTPRLARAECLAHLSECPACASRQKMADDLRALAAQERKREAPPRVEAFLLAEFRRHGQGSRLTAPRKPVAAWRMPALWAAAAGLVLMASALWRIPGQHRLFVPAATQPAAQAADMDDAEESNGFIPLPSAEGLGPSDDVNVVSVEVPRSAVAAAGIPLADDRASEMVKADVMLGPDGLARAIRLAN